MNMSLHFTSPMARVARVAFPTVELVTCFLYNPIWYLSTISFVLMSGLT